MQTCRQKLCVLVLAISASTIVMFKSANATEQQQQSQWSMFAYGGQWNDNSIGEILTLRTDFENSYIWVVGVARQLHTLNRNLTLELEANTAVHSGRQSHMELNSALSLRWHHFPWNHCIKTTVAYGLGPSYALKKPRIEQRSQREAAHLLVFMPVEITFARPHDPNWQLLLRVHHRSGAYGVVSDASGSNFVTVGLRYRF